MYQQLKIPQRITYLVLRLDLKIVRVHLKLTDTIPVHRIEIDIASRTPKQEGDEPDYFPTTFSFKSEM